mgnify:CR=1 FL=1
MPRTASTIIPPVCNVPHNLSNVRKATVVITVFALMLAGCGALGAPDVAPQQVGVVSQHPEAWYVLYSEGTSEHPQALSGAAWGMSLPSSGHLNYLQTPYRTVGRPAQIVMTYKITASSDAVPVSDNTASPCREHNPCTPVAEFRVYFQQAGSDLKDECGRWWYKPGFRLTDVADASFTPDPFVADGQLHTISIPLNAQLWTSVSGKGKASDFEAALKNAGWVGITFGGTDFFGHGVYMKQGTAQFEMVSYHLE